MKSLVFLALLLFLFERSTQEVEVDLQENDIPDVGRNAHAELKELRAMVTEQRVGMQTLKDKLAEQAVATGGELRRLASELEAERRETSALSARLTAFESRTEPRVAFSVGLTDSGVVGPYDADVTLIYENVFYNHGQAYDPATGVFTAPKRGAYFFTVTAFNQLPTPTGINLYHNQKLLRHNWGPGSRLMYYSNAIAIHMEAGDVLYVRLRANHSLYDNANNFCSLTGFLLFTL